MFIYVTDISVIVVTSYPISYFLNIIYRGKHLSLFSCLAFCLFCFYIFYDIFWGEDFGKRSSRTLELTYFIFIIRTRKNFQAKL